MELRGSDVGDSLLPGGGCARSTLQEVGRRNWIPGRSKQHQLERRDGGKLQTHAYVLIIFLFIKYIPCLTPQDS